MHCRSSLYMWSLCLGLPVKSLRAASMPTSPSIVLLLRAWSDYLYPLSLLFCLTVAAQNLAYYIYMCSPFSMSTRTLFFSALHLYRTCFSLSLSLSASGSSDKRAPALSSNVSRLPAVVPSDAMLPRVTVPLHWTVSAFSFFVFFGVFFATALDCNGMYEKLSSDLIVHRLVQRKCCEPLTQTSRKKIYIYIYKYI